MEPLRRINPAALAFNLLLALALAALLALLLELGPQEGFRSDAGEQRADVPGGGSGAPSAPPAPPIPPAARASPIFLSAQDTINGERISDPLLIQRIERIAAGLPARRLGSHQRAPRVRYLAQGFGRGDDAQIFYGVFREPAAALAFGCAVDDDLSDRCDITPVAQAAAGYDDDTGLHCEPMRLALGAAAYEPDRCEAGG